MTKPPTPEVCLQTANALRDRGSEAWQFSPIGVPTVTTYAHPDKVSPCVQLDFPTNTGTETRWLVYRDDKWKTEMLPFLVDKLQGEIEYVQQVQEAADLPRKKDEPDTCERCSKPLVAFSHNGTPLCTTHWEEVMGRSLSDWA